MKKTFLVLGFLLLAVAILVTFPCYNQLFAISGCCKERASYKAGWSNNGATFKQCKDLNRQDGDDVFQQRGLVWWDVRC